MSEKNITTNTTKDAANFYQFIDKYRVIKVNGQVNNVKPSHTSMGSILGSFNIPDDKNIHFFKYYQKMIKSGIIPSILETHLDQGPILIDLDFKYTLKTDSPNTRIYTDLDIENVLKIYNQVIMTYLSINEDDINIYVLEKPQPKIIQVDDTNKKTTYKDGVHIIYPFICANNKLQFFFRELVLNKIIADKVLDHLNLDNTIDDVIDKAVIERNNWLLYGSGKDSNSDNLYKLTKIYDINFEQLDMNEVDKFNLPTLLSIRKFRLAEDHSEYIEGINMDKINALYTELIGKKTNNKPFSPNCDIKKARMLTSLLSSNRAKSYSTWIEVGFCLHNIDDLLLDDWIEFSQKSPDNFKEGECEKLWLGFKYEGLSIGSLYRWAKEDNPEAYSDFLLNELDDIIKSSLSFTSYAVAKVFYELNKYQYICTSVSKKKWYEFVGHRWTPMDEANSIIKKLNTELADSYIKLAIAFNNKALVSADDERKRLLNNSQIANKIANKLREMSFKKNIIAELAIIYYDPRFMEKLDENRYLIGFDNGIYDLKNGYFRNGRPEDFVSMTTNCDYIKYSKSNESIQAVYHFFEQIQPEFEMREYLLTKLSSFLEGIQRDQKFEIWTGTGANGKGRILKLVLDSFGDYACTIPITLLTKPRADSNSCTPALAMTKGKRCCAFQEPENDDKIYVGHMKNITGGDKLMARSLYSDPVEFYPQFKTILACNKLPDVPSADGGTWRRIRVVPFEMKFVDKPTETFHRKKIDNIDDLITEWRSGFMSILTEKYKSYIKNGIDEPPKVLLQTNEYQNNSDVFMEYIGDNILSTDYKDYISFSDLWEDFKKWYRESNRPDNKKPVKSDLKAEMENRLGKLRNGKFIGYRFKTNLDDDPENPDNYTNTDKLVSSYNDTSIAESNKNGKNIDFDTEEILIKSTKSIKTNQIIKKNTNNIDANLDIFEDDSIENIFIKNDKQTVKFKNDQSLVKVK
jgi:P4 family phage/plasmid primase-like protien